MRAKSRRISSGHSNSETAHNSTACKGDFESGGDERGYAQRFPAQLIALNLLVVGSTPTRPTISLAFTVTYESDSNIENFLARNFSLKNFIFRRCSVARSLGTSKQTWVGQ